jgi:hypothetical protein
VNRTSKRSRDGASGNSSCPGGGRLGFRFVLDDGGAYASGITFSKPSKLDELNWGAAKDARWLAQADAEALILDHGAGAYSEAR